MKQANEANETDMDGVFRALADPSRRRLLDSLNQRSGQTLRELGEGLSLTRQAVSKHLGVLEAAGLVTTWRRGREKLHYLNPAPVADLAERWISRYHRQHVQALTDLKRALEDPPVNEPHFIYQTYIQTTPEQLWQALTDPAFTARYWGGVTLESDWVQGSTYDMVQSGIRISDPQQVVLEADRPRRLSYTWHTFAPEWARHYGFTEEQRRRWAAEPRSRIRFEIEPGTPETGGLVKLTVTHEGFAPDSEVLSSVSYGWPVILSCLKTLLETGRAPGEES